MSEQRVYASRRRQLLLVASLVGIFVASLSVVIEPDPSTGLKPGPGDYLWVVIPGTILVAVLVWRAFKSRIVTDGRGIDLVRVVGHEFLPWSRVRHFEVHPTPSRAGVAVMARLHDELLVTVSNQINIRPVRDRAEAKKLARVKAESLRNALEADRQRRSAGEAVAPATAS
ncbi:MAG: hypothetical protein M3N98_01085 [Actinomycetota bacterium]|nr:hypothetical protein [Actinomycetota bacterium]